MVNGYGDSRILPYTGRAGGQTHGKRCIIRLTCDRMPSWNRLSVPIRRTGRILSPAERISVIADLLAFAFRLQDSETPGLRTTMAAPIRERCADILVPQLRMRLDETRHEAHARRVLKHFNHNAPGEEELLLANERLILADDRPSECRREESRRCTSHTARASCRAPTRDRPPRSDARRSRARPSRRAGPRCRCCTRRLCPRPMMRPRWTSTEPIGIPPSRRPRSASSIAACMNSPDHLRALSAPRRIDAQHPRAGR